MMLTAFSILTEWAIFSGIKKSKYHMCVRVSTQYSPKRREMWFLSGVQMYEFVCVLDLKIFKLFVRIFLKIKIYVHFRILWDWIFWKLSLSCRTWANFQLSSFNVVRDWTMKKICVKITVPVLEVFMHKQSKNSNSFMLEIWSESENNSDNRKIIAAV